MVQIIYSHGIPPLCARTISFLFFLLLIADIFPDLIIDPLLLKGDSLQDRIPYISRHSASMGLYHKTFAAQKRCAAIL